MPEISRFLGIVVRMHYRDHAPPHFHEENWKLAEARRPLHPVAPLE